MESPVGSGNDRIPAIFHATFNRLCRSGGFCRQIVPHRLSARLISMTDAIARGGRLCTLARLGDLQFGSRHEIFDLLAILDHMRCD